MKRGYIALGIIAAIALLSGFATSAVTARADKLEQLAAAACKNEEYIDDMQAEWEKNREFFSCFISHMHLEPIDYRIEGLDYVGKDEKIKRCTEITACAKELSELFSLSLFNIF